MSKKHCYTKKLVSEGLPEKSGMYDTDLGNLEYDFEVDFWYDGSTDKIKPKWWLSAQGEKHVLSDEELKIELIKLLDWYEKLTPAGKVSVWSKDGQSHGLFNKDNEQLVDNYLTTKQDEQNTND